MNKLLPAVVCICLLLGGCGMKNAQGTDTTASPVQTVSAPQTPSPTPTPAPTPEPTPAPSQIVTAEYETQDYSTGESRTKKLSVYLPEGYDENGQYNAVFLMHVAGCNERFWPDLGIQALLDDLIASGTIPPVVAFMPDGYIRDEVRQNRNDPGLYTQFAQELRNDLLPFCREQYALYEGREHFGFAGASFGSYVTVNCALCENLDAFSCFGCVGGGTIDQTKLEESWSRCGTADCDVRMLYIAEGEYDDRGPAELSSINLRSYCDKFDENNLRFSLIAGVGHDANEWVQGVAEALAAFGFPA